MVFQREAGALAKAVRTKPRTAPWRGSFAQGVVTMRDRLNNRAGFDRVLMAVAATFLTVSATSALAQADPARNSAADLAIDAAVPRPEPANVPPPTVNDFKPDATASAPDTAKLDAAKATDSKPADVATAPAHDTSKSDTATTTPAPPAAASATPAAEPAKEATKQ